MTQEGNRLTAVVIGAAACGLPALKTCLEYGFETICFEKTSDMGGLWRYKPQECDGEASVAKTTIINTSKERMAFTDFPPPKEFPNFMHNRRVMEYFRMYADHFKLIPRIRFNTSVKEVSKAEDYETTGRWRVTTVQNDTKNQEVHYCDAVFMCTGHHVDPYVPKIPGQERFKGRILHSHSYKSSEAYEEKRGIVVGIGNSGGDISVELSRVTEQLYLVTRRGTWIFNRIGDNGLPFDIVTGNLWNWVFARNFFSYANYVAEKKLNKRFDHEKFGLKPEHHVYQQHPTVNDELPSRIAAGAVIVKPNIKELTEHAAVFEDGSHADIDFIVLATGYSFSFPYLAEDNLVPVADNEVSLYKFMMPPNLPRPGLFVIGLFQPTGALMPIAEMQCRVACEFVLGKARVPSKQEMLRDIKRVRDANLQRYVGSRRHTIQTDYEPILTELAELIGAGIPWTKFLFTDPIFAWNLFFGPCLPYHFRLAGSKPWPGAKSAIQGVWDRIYYPTAKNKGAITVKSKPFLNSQIFFTIVAVFAILIIFAFS